MLQSYCDYEHDAIVNYETNHFKNAHGIDKINMIFKDVKDSIYYSKFTPLQKASETLVMGRGNNADKCILLNTLLKNEGFDCCINKVEVIDNSCMFISRTEMPVPWFYVEVEFFGMKMNYDPSFDKSYMRAAGITHRECDKGYDLLGYRFKGKQDLFSIVGKPEKVIGDETFTCMDIDSDLKPA